MILNKENKDLKTILHKDDQNQEEEKEQRYISEELYYRRLRPLPKKSMKIAKDPKVIQTNFRVVNLQRGDLNGAAVLPEKAYKSE